MRAWLMSRGIAQAAGLVPPKRSAAQYLLNMNPGRFVSAWFFSEGFFSFLNNNFLGLGSISLAFFSVRVLHLLLAFSPSNSVLVSLCIYGGFALECWVGNVWHCCFDLQRGNAVRFFG